MNIPNKCYLLQGFSLRPRARTNELLDFYCEDQIVGIINLTEPVTDTNGQRNFFYFIKDIFGVIGTICISLENNKWRISYIKIKHPERMLVHRKVLLEKNTLKIAKIPELF